MGRSWCGNNAEVIGRPRSQNASYMSSIVALTSSSALLGRIGPVPDNDKQGPATVRRWNCGATCFGLARLTSLIPELRVARPAPWPRSNFAFRSAASGSGSDGSRPQRRRRGSADRAAALRARGLAQRGLAQNDLYLPLPIVNPCFDSFLQVTVLAPSVQVTPSELHVSPLRIVAGVPLPSNESWLSSTS